MSARRAPPVTPEDLHAAAAADAELGREYQDAVTDSLVDRFDAQLQHRLRERGVSVFHDAVTVVIALGSIGLGVTFVAAADPLGAFGGTIATIVAWIAIVVVNVAHARARGGR